VRVVTRLIVGFKTFDLNKGHKKNPVRQTLIKLPYELDSCNGTRIVYLQVVGEQGNGSSGFESDNTDAVTSEMMDVPWNEFSWTITCEIAQKRTDKHHEPYDDDIQG